MNVPTTILVAETVVNSAVPLILHLQDHGFRVLHAIDRGWTLKLTCVAPPDLVLLAMDLPRIAGLTVCRTLRAESAVPILRLVAPGQEQEQVRGLELGADGCRVNPFGFRELLARIRMVLRRHDPNGGNGTPPTDRIVVRDIQTLQGLRASARGAKRPTVMPAWRSRSCCSSGMVLRPMLHSS